MHAMRTCSHIMRTYPWPRCKLLSCAGGGIGGGRGCNGVSFTLMNGYGVNKSCISSFFLNNATVSSFRDRALLSCSGVSEGDAYQPSVPFADSEVCSMKRM